MEVCSRLMQLPPYLFAEIDKAKRAAKSQGRDVIDLGIGDPDTPTPGFIISAMKSALDDPANHRYALDQGLPELRKEIALWHKRRMGISFDPESEILPLIGSKEGIAHLPFALNNPDDINLVPSPCYPPYRNCTILAGGEVYEIPLLKANGFLPDLNAIPEKVFKKTKIMFLNYPNNPTSAVADISFFKDAVKLAEKYDFVIAQDMAYSEMFYGKRPPSIFEVDKEKKIAVEFHSLSKTYNMTGWRCGWVCGRKDVVSALAKFKSNIDSGIFQAVQYAAIAALKEGDAFIEKMQRLYYERRNALVGALKKIGMDVVDSNATFYVWTAVEGGSIEYAKRLLDKADIIATPGVGFGKAGEGFIRFALTVDIERIKEAAERIERLM